MMATQHQPVPFPSAERDRDDGHDEQEDLSPGAEWNSQANGAQDGTLASSARLDSFYSTSTAPLPPDSEGDATAATGRPSRFVGPYGAGTMSKSHARSASLSSVSTSRTSIMDRPRPQSGRPSSFFGLDADAATSDAEDTTAGTSPSIARTSGDWGRSSGDWARPEGAPAGYQDELDSFKQNRRGSFFGLEPSPSHGSFAPPTGSSSMASSVNRQNGGTHSGDSSSLELAEQRRGSSNFAAGEGSGRASPRSSAALTGQQESSGSGSHSSHSSSAKPRYHSTSFPRAASRTASIYTMSATSYEPSPPPPPLLDQSHLKPGNMASLLNHEKTLELYRENAKKTNDPDVQFEFCTFTMEAVKEMEEADSAVAQRMHPEERKSRKEKQRALVAESVTLLNKLAMRGHVQSQYFLADCFTQGVGTAKGKREYDKALALFQLASKHGHADACFRVGQCYENGWGCRKDHPKAVTFYRKGAALSHAGAMHHIGLAEINGSLGLPKRPKEGVRWLKRAAELADQVDPPQPQSLHELALLHEKGIENVVFVDNEYAVELFARAAEMGYAPSAYKLGECYEYGKLGCPQSAALSIHFYNMAAQQNHREACFALTAWYLVGSPGTLPQSDIEAYLWAKKAAEQGLAKAEYAVGYFTEMGIGTFKDQREAMEWFRRAAEHGDKRAIDRLHGGSGAPIPPALPSKQQKERREGRRQSSSSSKMQKPRGQSVDSRWRKSSSDLASAAETERSNTRASDAPSMNGRRSFSFRQRTQSQPVEFPPKVPPHPTQNGSPRPKQAPTLAPSPAPPLPPGAAPANFQNGAHSQPPPGPQRFSQAPPPEPRYSQAPPARQPQYSQAPPSQQQYAPQPPAPQQYAQQAPAQQRLSQAPPPPPLTTQTTSYFPPQQQQQQAQYQAPPQQPAQQRLSENPRRQSSLPPAASNQHQAGFSPVSNMHQPGFPPTSNPHQPSLPPTRFPGPADLDDFAPHYGLSDSSPYSIASAYRTSVASAPTGPAYGQYGPAAPRAQFAGPPTQDSRGRSFADPGAQTRGRFQPGQQQQPYYQPSPPPTSGPPPPPSGAAQGYDRRGPPPRAATMGPLGQETSRGTPPPPVPGKKGEDCVIS